MGILSALLPLAAQLGIFILNRINAKEETKKRYLQWIERVGKLTKSAALSQWVDKQMAELDSQPFQETK